MAQPPLSDSAKISLMTCAPWSGAVYALYGHTAVWVKDDSTHTDVVSITDSLILRNQILSIIL